MSLRWLSALRRPWGLVLMMTASLFALLTLVPVMPWRATCYEKPVPGPYRPIFLEEVTAWLAQQDVYHWRIGDLVLIRILPLLDGNDNFNRETTILNVVKISDMLEDDVTIDGTLYPKPPRVRELEEQQWLSGAYNGFELCRAAIQPSPADRPVPR